MRYIAEIRTYDHQWLLVGKAEYFSDLFTLIEYIQTNRKHDSH